MMKRSGLISMGLALILGIAFFVSRTHEEDGEVSRLLIQGFSQRGGEDDTALPFGAAPGFNESPIDEVLFGREDAPYHFKKEAQDWYMYLPQEGLAQSFYIEQILGLFQADIRSKDVREGLLEGDLRAYGLDPKNRLSLVLKSKGELWQDMDLWVGQVEEERGGLSGTWIMKKASPKQAFFMPDRDFRTPLSRPKEDYRSLRILSWKSSELQELEIENLQKGRLLIEKVEGKPSETGAEGFAWQVKEAENLSLQGDPEGLVNAILTSQVTAFYSKGQAPEGLAEALQRAPWQVSLRGVKGELKLKLGGSRGGLLFGQVQGKDEAFSFSSSLLKQLEEALTSATEN